MCCAITTADRSAGARATSGAVPIAGTPKSASTSPNGAGWPFPTEPARAAVIDTMALVVDHLQDLQGRRHVAYPGCQQDAGGGAVARPARRFAGERGSPLLSDQQ